MCKSLKHITAIIWIISGDMNALTRQRAPGYFGLVPKVTKVPFSTERAAVTPLFRYCIYKS